MPLNQSEEQNEYPDVLCGDRYETPEGLFNIFGFATHSDTGETLIILADNREGIWAKPADDFFAGATKV